MSAWSPVHPTSIRWIIRLGGNVGVLLQAATEIKTVPNLQMHFSWFSLPLSALPEKAIDNDVKDNRNWLQAFMSASGGNFEHVMLQLV